VAVESDEVSVDGVVVVSEAGWEVVSVGFVESEDAGLVVSAEGEVESAAGVFGLAAGVVESEAAGVESDESDESEESAGVVDSFEAAGVEGVADTESSGFVAVDESLASLDLSSDFVSV